MAPSPNRFMRVDRSMGAGYPVTLEAFDGPLDLLLQLIERQELDISEISLCAVTDQYLATLETLVDVEPDALADFLAVATRLLYIKSNRILPRPAEEEEGEEDTGDALVRQLIEYRQFRQVAEGLRSLAEMGQRIHVRPAIKKPAKLNSPSPADLSDLDINDLQTVLHRVLQRMPVEPPPPRVRAYAVTLSEQIEIVREYVRDYVRASRQPASGKGQTRVLFSSILGTAYTRTEVIVTFLAVLELIKQQELAVEQDATFGEIYLVPIEPGGELGGEPENEQGTKARTAPEV
jgi:segregation and condensation protein A